MGNIINAVAIIIGGSLGVIFKICLPNKVQESILDALGLIIVLLGISMFIDSSANSIVVISSFVVGTAIGQWIDFDQIINKLGEAIQS